MSGLIGQHHMTTVMISDVLPMTRNDLAGTSFKHQGPLLFQHSATPKNPEGLQTRHESEVLNPHCSNVASLVRWKISIFNDASSHLLRNSNKSVYYYIL